MDKATNILIDAFKYEKEYLLPSQIAEKYRILSDGNCTGPFSWEKSPQLRDFVDTLSPECEYTDIIMKKSSQGGFTLAGLANILLGIMQQYTGNILFMSNNDANVKKAMSGFISDMIRESGLSKKVGRPAKGEAKIMGSGLSLDGIKFNNGKNTLWPWSGQTVGQLSSITPKYGLIDEIERYKLLNKTGSVYSMIRERFKTYRGTHKLYIGSTPEVEATSIIEPLFKRGDQNYFNIPCPHCGGYIDLKWTFKTESGDYAGITYKRNNIGGLVENSVAYVCQLCGGSFTEKHKYEMYAEDNYSRKNSGNKVCIWIPTHNQPNKKIGSFHFNELYAGLNLGAWEQTVEKWCDIHPIGAPVMIDDLITFTNQSLGFTWQEKVLKVEATGLMKNQRNYNPGIVPDILSKEHGNGEVMFLVCSVDLNGYMDDKNPDNDDVRLNYTVTAYTESGNEDFHTSYEVMHGEIGEFERARFARERERLGETRGEKMTYRNGAPNSVWKSFEEDVLFKDWKTQGGKTMRIMLCGIDTGNYTIHANAFVSKHKNCIGIKGGRPDEFAKEGMHKPYIMPTEQPQLWKVDGNRLKDRIFESINTPWIEGSAQLQPVGHMNFPMSEGDLYGKESYFIEYEGEKREVIKNAKNQPTGYQWHKIHSESRQHYFDCRVYSEALVKIAMRIFCKESKVEYSFANFVSIMKLMRKG